MSCAPIWPVTFAPEVDRLRCAALGQADPASEERIDAQICVDRDCRSRRRFAIEKTGAFWGRTANSGWVHLALVDFRLGKVGLTVKFGADERRRV